MFEMKKPLMQVMLLVICVGPAVCGEGAETEPSAWTYPPVRPLRVLTVRGLWYRQWALERALARLGGAVISESWHAPKPHLRPKSTLKLFPATPAALMRHHMIVICNVNAGSFPPHQQKRIVEFVEHGGSVLFLGGFFAYGKEYRESEFARISPVVYPDIPCTDRRRVFGGGEGFLMKRGEQPLPWLAARDWAARPRVFWVHPVTRKPDARVVLRVGDEPLLVLGTFGKGRVAVFTGSVMGEPGPERLAFWEWPDWPTVLAAMVEWLTEERAMLPNKLPESLLHKQQLGLLGSGEPRQTADGRLTRSTGKAAAQAPLLEAAADRCFDKSAATVLLQAVVLLEDDPPRVLTDRIAAAVRPHIDRSHAPLARRLIDSALPHKVYLGLRVLGRSRTPDARGVLESALKRGAVKERTAGTLDVDEFGALAARSSAPLDTDYESHVIKLGAIRGLGDLGDAAALPLLRGLRAAGQMAEAEPEEFPIDFSRGEERRQAATIAALQCGDAGAAGPAVDVYMENRYVLIRVMNIVYMPHFSAKRPDAEKMIVRARRVFPLQRRRVEDLPAQFSNLPVGVLAALAGHVAAETDPRVLPLAFAAFGRQFRDAAVPEDVSKLLRGAALPAVADLVVPVRAPVEER